MSSWVSRALLLAFFFIPVGTLAGVGRLTLDSEISPGWLSQGIGFEGTFLKPDSRERNLLLRRDERERLLKRRKGLAPIRWSGGYRFSRAAYAGIGGLGDTEELGHRLSGGLGARILEEVDFNLALGLEDFPTEPYGSGSADITLDWHPTSRWGFELKFQTAGFKKRSGGAYLLADGTLLSPAAASAQKSLWGLKVTGQLSDSVHAYILGDLSQFGGSPQSVVSSMNGFIELQPSQVLSSSGFSPLRSLYASMRDIHVEGGIRLGRDPLQAVSEGPESESWFVELRGDWSRSTISTFPSVFRVMPGVSFPVQDNWRVGLMPEIWVADTTVDWLANLGLKVLF